MTAYYNEFDPKAAAWLRELIRCGHIAPGDVDERSIEDVTPADLAGYDQCHFFAGIGVWSHALRRAGWPDDRPAWTGSCPCQPFSAAGKGDGFADERHLWPALHHLISQCRPPVVFGEQVASKPVDAWIDLVHADLEAVGYALGSVPFPAAGVGAPHIRDRNWWVGERLEHAGGAGWLGRGPTVEGGRTSLAATERSSAADRLAEPWKSYADWFDVCWHSDCRDSDRRGCECGKRTDAPEGWFWDANDGWLEHASGDRWQQRRAEPSGRGAASGCGDGGLADTIGQRGRGGEPRSEDAGDVGIAGEVCGLAEPHDAERGPDTARGHDCHGTDTGRSQGSGHVEGRGGNGGPGPVNGLWRDADWLFCRDGKWRAVEPRTFPLAHGAPARVGRLRGYGNAIVAPAAQAFIEAYEEARAERFRLTGVSGMTTDEGVFE